MDVLSFTNSSRSFIIVGHYTYLYMSHCSLHICVHVTLLTTHISTCHIAHYTYQHMSHCSLHICTCHIAHYTYQHMSHCSLHISVHVTLLTTHISTCHIAHYTYQHIAHYSHVHHIVHYLKTHTKYHASVECTHVGSVTVSVKTSNSCTGELHQLNGICFVRGSVTASYGLCNSFPRVRTRHN